MRACAAVAATGPFEGLFSSSWSSDLRFMYWRGVAGVFGNDPDNVTPGQEPRRGGWERDLNAFTNLAFQFYVFPGDNERDDRHTGFPGGGTRRPPGETPCPCAMAHTHGHTDSTATPRSTRAHTAGRLACQHDATREDARPERPHNSRSSNEPNDHQERAHRAAADLTKRRAAPARLLHTSSPAPPLLSSAVVLAPRSLASKTVCVCAYG